MLEENVEKKNIKNKTWLENFTKCTFLAIPMTINKSVINCSIYVSYVKRKLYESFFRPKHHTCNLTPGYYINEEK